MARDWSTTLVEPQAVLTGQQIESGRFDEMPGNLNHGLAEPVLSIMDLRVPDAETPMATLVGAGAGTWTDLFSSDLRIPSPAPAAALFSVLVTLRVEVLGLAGLARVNLASGPTAGAALPVMGAGDVTITVGPIAAPYDDLMVQIRGAAGCTIEAFGVAIEYVALADPLPVTDFGGDEVALDAGLVAVDEPYDAAMLAAFKANLAHQYARPKPIYFRVGFNSSLSGQESLEAPFDADNGVQYVNRIGFPPSVGAGESVQVWLVVRNNDGVNPQNVQVYYGPADRWPHFYVEVQIAAATTAAKLFDVPAREERDIQSFTWPMAELGIRSFEDVEVLAVSVWAA